MSGHVAAASVAAIAATIAMQVVEPTGITLVPVLNLTVLVAGSVYLGMVFSRVKQLEKRLDQLEQKLDRIMGKVSGRSQ